MKTPAAYAKMVAILTLVSGLLALLCLVLLGIALGHYPEAIADPVQLLNAPDVNVTLLRNSMLADLLGYYLLLLPIIYYLRPYLEERTPWAGVITFCGTAYVLGGAIGAAIMAEVATPLYTSYYKAHSAAQDQIRVVYQAIIYLVYDGLWNLLGSLLAGAWWLLTGYVLTASHRALGWFTFVVGAFTVLDPIGNLLEIGWLAEIGLNAYLVLSPAWAIWMGLTLWRKSGVRLGLPALQQVV